jgi:RNA polymerase sigma factor (sigma-70 family)
MSDQYDHSETHLLVERALKEHESALIGYTANILNGDVERARDVVQDALLKLCKADPAKVRENLKAWLFTICRNRAFDVLRKEQRLEFNNDKTLEWIADDQPEPGYQSDIQELSDQVWTLVEALSPNYQDVLKLKFQHDCSYQQIAEITGLTIGNVGFILHNALRKLRAKLEKQLAHPATPTSPR